MEEQGGILTGRHAGEMSEGDLGIETALAMRVEDLSKELEVAKASSTKWEENYYHEHRKYVDLQNTIKDFLISFNTEGVLETQYLRQIANACDLELTREVSFSGTLAFSGTTEVSIFEDFDQYELSIDSFDLSYNGESINDLQSDIQDADEDSY